MKRAILSIGYHHYLLPADANIAAILKAIGQMVEVEQDYKSPGYVYYPTEEQRDIKLEMIDAKRVLKAKPEPVIEPDIVNEPQPSKRNTEALTAVADRLQLTEGGQ